MMFHRSKFFAGAGRWLCALLLLAFFLQTARAQSEPAARWLLIFDTSVAMKTYLPATRTAVRQFLANAANGQLHKGDSLGVWSFDQQISTQFKAYNWEPKSEPQIVSNLVQYLNAQRYSGDSRLAALQLPLSRIIAGSRRLTVAIFCDGQSPIHFTPYDDGVNQSFLDGLSERQKSRQPFVVVLRAQMGKFIGCTVNYPPGNLNLPDFPPLPPPPKTNAPPRSATPLAHKPKTVVPSLVIVGNQVSTHVNAVPKPAPTPKPAVVAPTNAPQPTNPPAATTTAGAAKPPVAPPTNLVKTAPARPSAVPQPAKPVPAPAATQAMATVAAPPATTNAAPAAAAVDRDRQTGVLIVVGVGLLLLAVFLIGFLFRARRRPQSSLISSSMQDRPPRK